MTDKMTSNWWTEKEKELVKYKKQMIGKWKFNIFLQCKQQHEKEMAILMKYPISNDVNSILNVIENSKKGMVAIADVEKAICDIISKINMVYRSQGWMDEECYEILNDYERYLKEAMLEMRNLSQSIQLDKQRIELDGKPMIPPSPYTSGKVTTVTSVLCSCGHDRSCHPRRPCIVGWDGIDNHRACQCTEFTPKKAEEQQK